MSNAVGATLVLEWVVVCALSAMFLFVVGSCSSVVVGLVSSSSTAAQAEEAGQ